MSPELTIATDQVGDAAAAARLHREQLTDSFLATLGERFLGVLYRRVATDPGSVLLVARRAGQVVGFIAGTSDTGQLYRTFMKKDGLRAGAAAAPALLRHPWRTVETLRYGAGDPVRVESGPALPRAELLSLAVDPVVRRTGVGAQLIGALQHELAARGVTRMRVTVASDNAGAIAAYRRCAFQPAATVEVHRGHSSELLVWG